jgi:hypothetical protein
MDLIAFKYPSDPDVNRWAAEINYACEGTTVPPCLLAAIVKRESLGLNVFQEGVPRGAGCGVGLCQITYGVDWSDVNQPTYDNLNLLVPSSNLHVAVNNFLEPLVAQATAAQRGQPIAFAASCKGQVAYAVAAGYNAGWGAVEAAMLQNVDADTKTTDQYAQAVFERYLAYVAASHGP